MASLPGNLLGGFSWTKGQRELSFPRRDGSVWSHCWHYPQGGARDLPHSQAVELVVCGAPGSSIGSVELKQSWFSHVYAVYGSHDTQFNMVIVTIPTEVALNLTHWKQAASDNSECPWVYKALWSPYSRMRATQGGVPSLDTKRSESSEIATDSSTTG